jgi:hypothetical protein
MLLILTRSGRLGLIVRVFLFHNSGFVLVFSRPAGRYATAFLSAAIMCECTGRDIYIERSIVHKEVVVGVKAFY